MMPQKKNPDVAELVRGQAPAACVGALVGAADDAEGPAARVQPRSPGRQGAALRRGARRCATALDVLTAMLPELRFDARRMAAAADGLLLATDVADLLVERHGMPFREAHEVVGGLVRHCLATGRELGAVDAATLRRLSRHSDARPRARPHARALDRATQRRRRHGHRLRCGALARAARENVR